MELPHSHRITSRIVSEAASANPSEAGSTHDELTHHSGLGVARHRAQHPIASGLLDPAFAPGTGTPEAGGLTPREVLELLRGLKGIDIVGGDVVEVAPQYDATTNTAQAAAQMLFEIVALIALARGKRR
jgi:hypothetical protein